MSCSRLTAKNFAISMISLFVLIILLPTACDKNEIVRIIKVRTDSVSHINYTSCIVTGTLIDKGEQKIDLHGFCYSLTEEPGLNDLTKRLGSKSTLGTFTDTITGLTVNTPYFVRAFARNEIDTYFGEQISFQTLAYSPPTIVTSPPTDVTKTTATLHGEVTDAGGLEVTDRGIWYSTSENAEISGTQIQAGNEHDNFSVELTGLTIATVYYIKAYATNSLGTSFGDELVFSTNRPPSVFTNIALSITQTTAIVGGDVYDDGGQLVTEKGIYFSTSPGADTSGIKLAIGIGLGSFLTSLTELMEGTAYYIKAYAINSIGTSFGTEVSFGTQVNDFDENIYNTVPIGSQLWMAENMKVTHYSDGTVISRVEESSAWNSLDITDKAYCFYENSLANKNIYGALYTWAAAMNGTNSSSSNPSGVQGVCPSGWHLPSDDEWKQLEMDLGMSQIEADRTGIRGPGVGGKLKEAGRVHWTEQNIGASNESGFTALPGGFRFIHGYFANLESGGHWWSSTEHPDYSESAWTRELDENHSSVGRGGNTMNLGFSVRCLRD